MRHFLPLTVLSLLILGATGCASPESGPGPEGGALSTEQTLSDDSSTPRDDPSQTIIVTTTILGSVVEDIVECVGDASIGVDVLMPIGVDPHDFQPSSAQLAQMVKSGTVIANGLGLEQGLIEPLEQVESDGVVVVRVAEWIEPLPFGQYDTDHQHSEEDSHAHGDEDPHFWFDMSKMAQVSRTLGEILAPTYGEEFESCGARVAEEIEATDREVSEILSAVPESSRVLVTDHDAFGYFAEHYDFEVLGVVIPGGSTLAEPSSEDLAALVDAISAEGLSVIFGNQHLHSDLLNAVASEASGNIAVANLYVGSVGEETGPAADYVSMMRENARIIAQALAG